MNEKTIYLAAVEIADPSQQRAYLDDVCRDQPTLRRGVEQLLAAVSSGDDFLETPPPVVVALAAQCAADPSVEPDLEFLVRSARPDSLGRLGHFEILEVVGSGGCGVVLRAFDEKLLRIVAIKTLAVSVATSATVRKRFVREAQAAAAVNHDNVVDIYAVEEAGPVPYLVMEYVAGVSLEDKLREGGPLELREMLRIGLQTAEGLAAAHRQGLVHRDIKPANILLENGVQRVKITDFGLARAVDDASLTQAGIIAGTPSYMSPEQANGAPVDHRSDLFSLGSVLYAMCAGQPPFKSSTSLGAIQRVRDDTPRSLDEVNHDVPGWLCAVIEKLLAKDAAGRYQTALEVVEVLSRGLAHAQQPVLISPPNLDARSKRHSSQGTSRRRWWVAAAALGLLFAGLGVAEATGVTRLSATIIRILTPDGTLVVEISDPGVNVTVDDNGDSIVITGAGIHELRLRPGQHRVWAAKDGKPVPVDRPLVTIEKGGKQIVKVVREVLTLSRLEKLQRAERLSAEVDRLIAIGEPLRSSDPWRAEAPFREALGICEQLVNDFPEVQKYQQRRADCRFSLASTLGMQTHQLVFKGTNLSASEISRALAAAKEATELLPQDAGLWTHLGRAQYRAKDWQASLAALEKGPREESYNGSSNRFFLAMVHWQLGNKKEAGRCLDEAVRWMDANKATDPSLGRARAEATELFGGTPSAAPGSK